jgi:cell fate (sporulation/competence/biofilm development) regulator YmcA (YheA/YmcA/DUF963 family)
MPKSQDSNDLLDKIRQEMQDKLTELQPMVDEYNRIQTAMRRLDAKPAGRPKGSTSKVAVAA